MEVVIWVLAAIAVIAIAAVVWMYLQKRRTEQLRSGFGPEYERTVQERGDRRRAEAELQARRERVEKLELRRLSAAELERFTEAWRETQARFVDAPAGAIKDADRLVSELMQTRGYPVADFERRAADISVDHPNVVSNYRAAHRIAMNQEAGEASTEDLRQAMVHYRELFNELLEVEQPGTDGRRAEYTERTEVRR